MSEGAAGIPKPTADPARPTGEAPRPAPGSAPPSGPPADPGSRGEPGTPGPPAPASASPRGPADSVTNPPPPASAFLPAVPASVLERSRLHPLVKRFSERTVWAGFVFVNGFITIAVLAWLARLTRTPLVFPSLGPTAFLFFFTPTLPAASPRNTMIGHAIGIVCGWGSLWVCGLEVAPPAFITGVDGARVVAAGLSLAATAAGMVLFRAPHPPAGATTLIISLGVITRPAHLLGMEFAIGLLTLQALLVNRLAGVDYPTWRARS